MRMVAALSGLVLCAAAQTAVAAAVQFQAAPQPAAPASVILVHADGNAPLTAKLQNRGQETIVAYRMGWVDVHNGNINFHHGDWIQTSVAPQQLADAPAPAALAGSKSDGAVFFVSEVKFEGGKHWKARRNEIVPVTYKPANMLARQNGFAGLRGFDSTTRLSDYQLKIALEYLNASGGASRSTARAP